MDRRRLLKTAAVVSATSAGMALHGSVAAAGLATAKGLHYATYAGADFRAHHGSIAQANYWDNGSLYGVRVGPGGTGFTTRLDLPDGATLEEASANLRFNSGDGPVFLNLLGFDTSDGYQVVAQAQITDPSPALIRTVALDVTPTVIDNERYSYLLRWRPSWLETIKRDRPDTPEQLLWGFRIGYRGKP